MSKEVESKKLQFVCQRKEHCCPNNRKIIKCREWDGRGEIFQKEIPRFFSYFDHGSDPILEQQRRNNVAERKNGRFYRICEEERGERRVASLGPGPGRIITPLRMEKRREAKLNTFEGAPWSLDTARPDTRNFVV